MRRRARFVACAMSVGLGWAAPPDARADAEVLSPSSSSSPSPSQAVAALGSMYEHRFPTAALYWGLGGALVVTGVVTLALSPSPETSASDRLGVYSGSATLISGLSSCFSALPLTLARRTFELRLERARATGRPMDDGAALDVLVAQAGWARRWRIATQIVTPVLLALNGAMLGWYSARYAYERTTTGIVAGLYGIGVPIVLWYDSLSSPEEQALHGVVAGTARVTVGAMVLRSSRGAEPGVGVGGVF
jgi:hypothetical protein